MEGSSLEILFIFFLQTRQNPIESFSLAVANPASSARRRTFAFPNVPWEHGFLLFLKLA